MAAAVKRAAELLRAGALVAVPTETVYGLAANALNPDAVARIFAVKGRPTHNPIIVHVASDVMAKECASIWPEPAERLARTFWPGPLTLVVPKAGSIPLNVTAGGPTVGVRWPQHPFMQALIRCCGFPLAAPSANLANRLSPTNATHVVSQLGESVPLIVDGGDCNVGIESTVIDVTRSSPQILRPGMITEPAVRAAMAGWVGGEGATAPAQNAGPLRSPGLLQKHYAPHAQVCLRSWQDEADLLRQMAEVGAAPEKTFVLAHTCIPLDGKLPNVLVIPPDPEAFARGLYAELHRCDTAGADFIVVEQLPETPEWSGIRDRLHRAAAGRG